jgi:virginiamycin B lyase
LSSESPVAPVIPRRRQWLTFLSIAAVAIAAAAAAWWTLQPHKPAFVEYPMTERTDMPTAIALAPDGTAWFSIDFSDAIGIVRNGKVERLPKGSRNAEPIGLGVDAAGNAWLADPPAIAIQRIAPNGEIRSFPLGTPIARLGRLTVAADGGVWFAESTAFSVTRLKDGELKRHEISMVRGAPFGVAAAADGSVWATLQAGNSLLHIAPDGTMAEFEVPTRGAAPTDIVVDAGGMVWFLEFRANKIGRFRDGKFKEIDVPLERAALSGLAAAPDGTVWFGSLRGGALGRVKDDMVKMFPLPREGARPFSVAVDRAGNVWYADITGWVGMLPAAEATR